MDQALYWALEMTVPDIKGSNTIGKTYKTVQIDQIVLW